MAAWRGSLGRRCLPAAPPPPGTLRMVPCSTPPHARARGGHESSPNPSSTGVHVDPPERRGPVLRGVVWGPEVGSPAVRLEPLPPLPPSGRECEEFDAVWYDLARQLQMGKSAAASVALLVQRGKLPCDALKLHARAQAFLEAAPLPPLPGEREPAAVGALRTRLLLSEMPGLVLRYPAGALTRVARRLHLLLPSVDPTLLLGTLMEDLHSAAPELLVLKFLELNSVFRAVFGTDVPQRIFHYLCADAQQQRQRKRLRQQQLQEQRLWARQKQDQQRQDSPPPSRQQASQRDPASSAPPTDSDSAALSPLQLQSRLLALCGVLGREVAFVVLCNQPQLLDLDPSTAQQRLAALSALLGMEPQRQERGREDKGQGERGANAEPSRSRPPSHRLLLPPHVSSPPGAGLGLAALAGGPGAGGESSDPRGWGPTGSEVAAAGPETGDSTAAALWWMLERRGDVLLMAPEQLQANLEALTEGLGWPTEEVAALVREEPLAVLMDWRTVAARAGQLEGAVVMARLTGQRAHWQQEFASGRVQLVGLVLRRSSETLDRLDFLLQHSAARPSVALLRVLVETKADFVRLCPAYRTWRVQGQAPGSALPPDFKLPTPQASASSQLAGEPARGRAESKKRRSGPPQDGGQVRAERPEPKPPQRQDRRQAPVPADRRASSNKAAAAARAAAAASLHHASMLLGQDDDPEDAGLVLLEQQ